MIKEEVRNSSRIVFTLDENGGRRSGIDRRQFSYSIHLPERRCGQDRRSARIDERTEKMPYGLRIDVEGSFLRVTAKGTRSFQTVLAMSQDILATCAEKDLKKVLIDVRSLEGRLGTIDAHVIVDKYFPKIRECGVINRCAVVDLKEFEHSYRFFETLAVNRGYLFRIFSGTDEAVPWLKK
jgi:hypothetical protein